MSTESGDGQTAGNATSRRAPLAVCGRDAGAVVVNRHHRAAIPLRHRHLHASVLERTVSVPLFTLAAGVGISLALGAVAGLYPAARAARLAPAEAIHPA